MNTCDDRVVVVTGAGRGLGRAHALDLAENGAKVVVNDLGVARDGSAGADDAASEVAAEIRALGGTAIANGADVSDPDQVSAMIGAAIEEWGRLDALVCNAGFLRDRMLANMSVEEWDAVTRVHLRGHFVPSRCAIEHWRERSKAGEDVHASLVNTTSGAGLMGSIGQGNYAAAKAGIACLTVQQAAEWGRYGVRVNAIAPDARTRMTAGVFYEEDSPEGWDDKDPANASPLVTWMVSKSLPKYYEAKTALLPAKEVEMGGGGFSFGGGKKGGNSGASMVLAALGGPGSGPSLLDLLNVILRSRVMAEEVVKELELVPYYGAESLVAAAEALRGELTVKTTE
ncbi:MAG: SDR family NAD(P)-dependent oxidoreductase, partial [Acidobacteria bacterium]|nr:SDR family NAD(P)-dependent oxidoreductase [Acidobacteriota bacterium]